MTPQSVAQQAPLAMGFPRQEYWSRFPFSTPEDLPYTGIEPKPLASPALASGFFTTVSSERPCVYAGTHTYLISKTLWIGFYMCVLTPIYTFPPWR